MDTFVTFLTGADHTFTGWDFSFITRTERMVTEPLPWSYASKVLQYEGTAKAMLDLGTGGGELLSLLQPFPPSVSATEGYAPNLAVARNRLEPLGVTVVAVGDNNRLPFPDARFDLIIDRHESYDPEEIFRVLRPEGMFITQQVGGQSDVELNEWLDIPLEVPWEDWSLEIAAAGLEAAALDICERQETSVRTRFYDVGAVIFYLRAIPWQFPGFSIERHRKHLEVIHERIMASGYVEVTSRFFLMRARKS
jgi:SAM-dependent methyltransferase